MPEHHGRRSNRFLLALAAFVLAATGAVVLALTARSDVRLLAMSTGGRSGVYYFAGGSICAMINAHRWQHGLRCATEDSGGSIENLQALRRGTADFAIVQSDWQHHAVRGTSLFETQGPDHGLRSVLALYPEQFTVVARADGGIGRVSDLRGKRVNLGPAGSGSRATMEVLMRAMGWAPGDFSHLAELATSELAQALCGGDIDAAVLIIAHPNLAVEEIARSCRVVLVPVDDDIVAQLVAGHPYYFASSIEAGLYPGQSAPVEVFALAATLVTAGRTEPSVAYEVARTIMEGLPGFRDRHIAFAEFDLAQMLSLGLTAPLHSGAARYFAEAGFAPGEAAR